jgi:hypothetical protein
MERTRKTRKTRGTRGTRKSFTSNQLLMTTPGGARGDYAIGLTGEPKIFKILFFKADARAISKHLHLFENSILLLSTEY